ncbi:MAG: hypothetical protein DBX05_06355 [Candidatus Poseidoniales archaeon]|nr:MAG: hypothetical protein DBX05_06355 [Candidatus Poseidoniales archaeon]
MALTPRQWVGIAALISLILVPILYYFWRLWDRPSAAAKEEMDRRKKEHDVRFAFEMEEMKLREEEARQAALEIQLRRRKGPEPIATSTVSAAFGQLGVNTELPQPMSVSDAHMATEPEENLPIEMPDDADIPQIEAMLESLPEVENEFIPPELGPIAIEIPKDSLSVAEEVKSLAVEPAPELDPWDGTDW